MHFVEPFLFLKVDVVDGDDSDGGDGVDTWLGDGVGVRTYSGDAVDTWLGDGVGVRTHCGDGVDTLLGDGMDASLLATMGISGEMDAVFRGSLVSESEFSFSGSTLCTVGRSLKYFFKKCNCS